MQAIEFARRLGAEIVAERPKSKNSLLNSLLAGNSARRRVRSGLPPQPTSSVSARCLSVRKKRATFPRVSRISAGLSGAKWLNSRSPHPIPARSLWWVIFNLREGLQRLRFDADCDRVRGTTRVGLLMRGRDQQGGRVSRSSLFYPCHVYDISLTGARLDLAHAFEIRMRLPRLSMPLARGIKIKYA